MARTPAAPLTLRESLAHLSREKRWTMAAFYKIGMPGVLTLLLVVQFRSISPSFFSSVPWRVALLLSWTAYLSLLFVIVSYAELFLPRTPVAVAENIIDVGCHGVGFCVLYAMVCVVFAIQVGDARVLAACTCVVVASIAGLVVFWVWLARKYGGGDGNDTLELDLDLEPGSSHCLDAL